MFIFPVGVNSISNVADPYAANVVLFLKGNGTNGSTTIVDSSPSPKSITILGNTQISTADSKYNGSSIYFDGTGDYLTAVSGDFALGTSDFTIEFWFKSEDVSSSRQRGFYQISPTSGGLSTNYANGSLIFQGSGNGINNVFGGIVSVVDATNIGSNSSVINTTDWFHCAISRNSGLVRFFLNGSLLNSNTVSTNLTSTNLAVGGYYNSSYLYQGFLSHYRITSTIGRYTTAFNPETDTYLNV